MGLDISRNGPKPLYKQIADYYRELIENDILKDGEPLPNQRDLANQLGVNRSTISNAYNELWSSGLIYSKQGRGTKVINPNHVYENRINWQQLHLKRKNHPSPFNAIHKKMEQAALLPTTINLATEHLFLDTFGIIDICKYHNQTIDKDMFTVILNQLFNIDARQENLLLTGGYSQGIFLIISAFLKKDDVVVVERPSILFHHHILKELGVRIIAIDMDGDGLIPEHLEILCRQYKVKMLFTQPTFQEPTGTLLPLRRRERLLAICNANRIPIVETASKYPLYHKVMGPPSLYSLAEDKSQIFSVGGFTELLGEGFKMGWIIAPNSSYDLLSFRKQELGLTVSPLEANIVGNILTQRNISYHLERFRQELYFRKNKMECLLNKHKGDLIKVNNTMGGKDLWCKIPFLKNGEAFLEKCLENGVVIMPGSIFGADSSFIKLSFATQNLDHISLGVSRLVKSMNELGPRNLREELTKVD